MKLHVNCVSAPGFSTLARKVRGSRNRGGVNIIKGFDSGSEILHLSFGGR